MNEKPPKRRLKLNVTEPPRRMLQEVVIKPDNGLDDYDKWLVNWYNARQDILANNIRQDNNDIRSVGHFFGRLFAPKKTAIKYAKQDIDKIKNARFNREEYVVNQDGKSQYGMPSIQTASDNSKNKLKRVVADDISDVTPDKLSLEKAIDYFGIINKGLQQGRTIFYKQGINPDIIIHERTHLSGPQQARNAIYGIGSYSSKKKYYNRALKVDKDPYLDSDQEIYSRLNALRYDLQLDPKKVWTIDEIRALTKDKRYDKSQLDLDRYTDEFLLHLFNEVADNNTTKQQNKRHLDLMGDYA